MHQLVFVLVDRTAADLESEVSRLLAGSERRPDHEFEKFQVACFCIGAQARRAGFEAFDGTAAGERLLEDLRQARLRRDDAAEGALLAERYAAASRLTSARDDFEQIDPSCRTCGGTGQYAQTRDPAVHCDWWSIGGRWSGLFGARSPDAHPPNTRTGRLFEQGDAAPVSEVRGAYVPAAVVTPPGDWHAGPDRIASSVNAFIEISREEKAADEAWAQEVDALLRRYGDAIVVAVDCHS